MDTPKDFIIAKVSWVTKQKGAVEPPERTKRHFRIVVDFLQQNNLVVRQLLAPGQEPDDEFCFRKSDLTEEGYEVIKKGYDRWLRRISDIRKDVTDITILRKALEEVRKSPAR
jgi:hypothetical protein